MKLLKELFKPKVLSARWFRESSRDEIMCVRDALWERLMDPNEEVKLRVQIRDSIFPLIDRHLRNKE